MGGSVPMPESLVGSLHCAKTLGIAANAKPLHPVRRLLPTSLGLLLSGRLKILLSRFVRLGSFADHTKRILKLISISIQSHFNSGGLDNPFGQRALRSPARAEPAINIGADPDGGPRKARSQPVPTPSSVRTHPHPRPSPPRG